VCVFSAVDAKGQQALDEALERWVSAFNKHDVETLGAEYAKDANALSFDGTVLTSRSKIMRDKAAYFESHPEVQIRLSNVQRKVVQPGVVIEDGTWDEWGHSDPKMPTHGRYSSVMVERDGRWQIVHERGWPEEVDSSLVAKEWLTYFVGDWTRSNKQWSEDGGWGEPEVVSWSCKMRAGGTATVATGKSELFGEWLVVEMLDGSGLFEAGSAGSGSHWTIKLSKVTKKELAGPIAGVLPDGRSAEGTTKLIKLNDDVYESVVELSVEDGSTVKFMARNERK
jgi:uncharacterized protein (TIGR02246 family)